MNTQYSNTSADVRVETMSNFNNINPGNTLAQKFGKGEEVGSIE
jgi:hypothetical protein